MKNLLLIFCLIYMQANAENTKIITNTEIKEIKVFQAGAQVNRIVKTTVEAGVTELKVEGLSANVDKNSILVSGMGDIILLSVSHQLDYLNSEKKLSEQTRIEDSLEILQNNEEKLNRMEAVCKDEQGLLQANKAVGGANIGVNMENLQKVADFFRNRMTELNNKLMDIHKDQKKLDDKIELVKLQLKELDTKRNQPTGTILITVSANAHTNVSLDLSYYVTGAGWTPQYDVRAKDINSPIQLAYKANVYQKTGEKWDDVKLKLSTGNPSQSGTKPNLTTWVLDFFHIMYSPPAIANMKVKILKNEESKEELPYEEMDSVAMAGNYSIASTSDYVTIDENQLATDFDIAIPYSIPSDGKKHLVDVQSFSMPALYSYYAVPKLDKDAFLVARLTKWEELNLLPGMANIYFEGAYVGESTIDPRNTKDTLDISLGRDKRIVITREKKKDLSSTKFIGSNVEKDLHYLITVRNTKKDKISITVEDQLPVTKNNDITVKPGENSGGDYNTETGKVTWKFDVAPSASMEKKLNFIVKYPKDRTVNGL